MDTRQATNEEVIKHLGYEIKYGRRAMFRHFIVEKFHPKTWNGVVHKQYGKSKVHVIDGVPMVRHHGKMEKLIASVLERDGKNIVMDVRIDGLK